MVGKIIGSDALAPVGAPAGALQRISGFAGLSYAYPLSWVGALLPQRIAVIFFVRKMPKDTAVL